jgi:hypothetical protein
MQLCRGGIVGSYRTREGQEDILRGIAVLNKQFAQEGEAAENERSEFHAFRFLQEFESSSKKVKRIILINHLQVHTGPKMHKFSKGEFDDGLETYRKII